MSLLDWAQAGRKSIVAIGILAGTAAGQTTIGADEADLFLISTQPSSGFAEMVTMFDDLDGDGWGEVGVGAPAFDPLDGSGRGVPTVGPYWFSQARLVDFCTSSAAISRIQTQVCHALASPTATVMGFKTSSSESLALQQTGLPKWVACSYSPGQPVR